MIRDFSTSDATCDLLGLGSPRDSSNDVYSPGCLEPGKMVDLSGGGSLNLSSESSSASSNSAGNSRRSFGGGSGRGPTSIEGGREISLAGFSPAEIVRQLASRPLTELVRDHGGQLVLLPRYAVRAYSAAATRYLRPWSEFLQLRPGRVIEGFRRATRRGEIQIYVQRNVIANARHFCPNYVFVFLAMLFAFVCTSPLLLGMLSIVGGGWSHALRNEHFRSRPWQLQIGGASVPLGVNVKMLVMVLPTLVFLHMFMGPVLWSAAFYSGGVSLAHASLRDREDDRDDEDHGLGSDRVQELP